MPYLDKDQLEGSHANLYLLCVMLAPSDQEVQRRLFECFAKHLDHQACLQFKPLIDNRHNALRNFFSEEAHCRIDEMLWNASPIASTADSIQKAYSRGLEDGRFVGNMLLRCLEHSESQRQAFQYFRSTAVRGFSRATESMRWRQARRAAHLWAQGLKEPIPSPYGDMTMRRFRLWLAGAERLRRRGERFIPKHSDSPLLRSSESWQVPKGLKR